MGAGAVTQHILGTKMKFLSPSGSATTSSLSVIKCISAGTAGDPLVGHRKFHASMNFSLWKDVEKGGAPRTVQVEKLWPPRKKKEKKRAEFSLPSAAFAGTCSSSVTVETVVREEEPGAPESNSASTDFNLRDLRKAGLIACLRTTSADTALDAARAALDGGLTVLEVTMTTPSAASVIQRLVREYPSAVIGAGTVLSWHEADTAKQAGAKFLTSPVTVEEMVRGHRDGPVLFIPGAMTPTEVVSAYNMGAPAVKLYPTALLGDIRFVLALRKTLGHIPLIPSSGISLDMVESYLSAGVTAVIISDAVFEKSALECRDFSRIRTLATSAASKNLSRNIQG
ncbi:hypothetical protein R1sor_023062 [Riccia sorocarpa]|uniref:Uncharacterized protein n=1 Tax=Riccia sorocarpa TaxID=122646 RepID=A0ABD3GN60_9MARC